MSKPEHNDDRDQRHRALLTKWRGAYAQLWSYSPSHAQLTIRVEPSERRANLHIVCASSERICGPTSWDNSHFEFDRVVESGETIIKLRDASVGFEVSCSGLSLMEDVAPIYEATFKTS